MNFPRELPLLASDGVREHQPLIAQDLKMDVQGAKCFWESKSKSSADIIQSMKTQVTSSPLPSSVLMPSFAI